MSQVKYMKGGNVRFCPFGGRSDFNFKKKTVTGPLPDLLGGILDSAVLELYRDM